MKRILSLSACLLLVMALSCSCSSSKTGKDDTGNNSSTSSTTAPIDYTTGIHHAQIDVKDFGTISVELNANSAPITVANFAKLSNEGFYDGLTFHRIINNFMIQGGDPDGNGLGGSDTKIKGEFTLNGVSNKLSHTRGAISMARLADDYDSATSQFFICQTNCSNSLDGMYAVFGYVTDGMDIVDKICNDVPNGEPVPKEYQPVIETIKMVD